jgi:hypothetical protein
VLRRGDVIVDAAGPFHARNTSLIATAIEIGFDVVDLNDNLRYCDSVFVVEPQIGSAGIRVLTSASSVSAVSAAVVRQSGIDEPVCVSTFLAPATRHTANAGTALALLRSVGRPVEILLDGRRQTVPGWKDAREFAMPPPVGPIRGRLFESAEAVNLPRIWPTLRDVAMYVDTNVPGGNFFLRLAARSPVLRHVAERQVRLGAWMARRIGASAGGIGYEIEGVDGEIVRWAITARENSYLVAVAPAVLAVRGMIEGRFEPSGLVPADQHVHAAELFEFLESAGVQVSEVR